MTDEAPLDIQGLNMVPTSSLPILLGSGFYIPTSIQILHIYSGIVDPEKLASPTESQISQDYQETYPQGATVFEKFFNAPFATFETVLEVVSFVVAVSSVLFQASPHRGEYLASRGASQLQLYTMLCQLFGFPPEKQVELDDLIVTHGSWYAPDISAGLGRFADAMEGKVKTDPAIFAQAALGYTTVAHSEIFGRTLLYTKDWLGTWTTTCANCRSTLRGRGLRSLEKIVCQHCRASCFVNKVYQ